MSTNFITSTDGTKIAYTQEGSGPALVLVDGAMCYRRAGTTPEMMPELSKNFTVYAYDRRGRDESEDTQPYAIEREIEDLKAIMDAAGGNPYVCGFSSGAALAFYGVAAGLKPKKLVLYEAPFVVVDDSDAKPPADCVAALDAMIAQNHRADAVSYFMKTLIGVPSIFLIMMKLFMRKNWQNCLFVAHTLPYDIRIMDQTKWRTPTAAAANITAPTMVIYGEKTAAKLAKASRSLAAAIPKAELKPLAGASHMIKASLLEPVLQEYFK